MHPVRALFGCPPRRTRFTTGGAHRSGFDPLRPARHRDGSVLSSGSPASRCAGAAVAGAAVAADTAAIAGSPHQALSRPRERRPVQRSRAGASPV